MHPKEYIFIEKALFAQRVTIRRTTAGHLVFRKDSRTIGFLHADASVVEMVGYLQLLAHHGRIRWPPEW